MILFASGKYNGEENRKFYAFENAKRRSPGSDLSIKALTKIDSHRRMERNVNEDKLYGYIITSGTGHIFIPHVYTKTDIKEWEIYYRNLRTEDNLHDKDDIHYLT